jgi:hypothetical protein
VRQRIILAVAGIFVVAHFVGPFFLLLFTEVPGSGILGSTYPGSCIAPVLWSQNRPIAPVRYLNPKPYILWCCIKMQEDECKPAPFCAQRSLFRARSRLAPRTVISTERTMATETIGALVGSNVLGERTL